MLNAEYKKQIFETYTLEKTDTYWLILCKNKNISTYQDPLQAMELKL